jgi:methylated-DNA-[protein]-cysteine S-methyltransferase
MNTAIFPTRAGWMAFASDEDGITNVFLPTKDKADAIDTLKKIPGGEQKPSQVMKNLEYDFKRYFRGERVDFNKYPISPRNQTLFRRYVWSNARKIPYGRTLTYGELAAKAGFPSAPRAVGGALGANPVPIIVPCHRVVSQNGLGGFSGGLDLKKELLELEGALA